MGARGGAECRTKGRFTARAVWGGRISQPKLGIRAGCDSDYSTEKIHQDIDLEHDDAEDDIKDDVHFHGGPRASTKDVPQGVKLIADGEDRLTGIENQTATLGADLDFLGAHGNRSERLLSTLRAGQSSF